MTVVDVDQLARIVRRGPDGRRLCSLPFCERAHASRGMCKSHHRQWKRTGSPLITRTTCAVDGCACGGKIHDTTRAAKTTTRRDVPGWLDIDRLAGHTPADGWRDRAACAGADVNMFFPVSGTPSAQVLATCTTCPVRYDCLAAELAHPRDYRDIGVWGGTTAVERQAIRDRLAARAVA